MSEAHCLFFFLFLSLLCRSLWRRPLKCEYCPATFLERSLLKKHMPTHIKSYQFSCSICDRRFERKVSLDKHESIHRGIRPHQCPFCDQSYVRADNLRNHVTLHTGEKPFPCGLCPMRFKFSGAASNHRRAAHMRNGHYRCERCAFAAQTFTLFKDHLLSCPLDAWWERAGGLPPPSPQSASTSELQMELMPTGDSEQFFGQ